MEKQYIVLSFVIGFFLSVNVNAARFYHAVELPSPYNGDWTYTLPTALNDLGEVVGYASPTETLKHFSTAIYWPNPNAIALLNVYEGTPVIHSVAHDINNSGFIVGTIANPDGGATQQRFGALWDRGFLVLTPGLWDINDPLNATTVITSINDNNVMVGTNENVEGLSRGFTFNRFGFYDEGNFLTGPNQLVTVHAINNRNEVVGRRNNEAFKVYAGGTSFETFLNILTFNDINEDGIMAAKKFNECLLLGGTYPVYFGDNNYDCAALAINDRRVVVGETTQFDAPGDIYKAFVYDDRATGSCESGVRDLTEITDFPYSPAATLISASDVNNQGQIVAVGVRENVTSAYLLTPATEHEPLPLSLDSNQNNILDNCEDVTPVDPAPPVTELAWLIPVLSLLL